MFDVLEIVEALIVEGDALQLDLALNGNALASDCISGLRQIRDDLLVAAVIKNEAVIDSSIAIDVDIAAQEADLGEAGAEDEGVIADAAGQVVSRCGINGLHVEHISHVSGFNVDQIDAGVMDRR